MKVYYFWSQSILIIYDTNNWNAGINGITGKLTEDWLTGLQVKKVKL